MPPLMGKRIRNGGLRLNQAPSYSVCYIITSPLQGVHFTRSTAAPESRCYNIDSVAGNWPP
jgi:hypothetical protein